MEIPREEVEAVLEVRREKGREIEPALIDSMAAKIDAAVRARYEAEVRDRGRRDIAANAGNSGRIAVGIVSLVMAIPLTAIVLGTGAGLVGLLVVWLGLVGVNLAMGLRRPPIN